VGQRPTYRPLTCVAVRVSRCRRADRVCLDPPSGWPLRVQPLGLLVRGGPRRVCQVSELLTAAGALVYGASESGELCMLPVLDPADAGVPAARGTQARSGSAEAVRGDFVHVGSLGFGLAVLGVRVTVHVADTTLTVELDGRTRTFPRTTTLPMRNLKALRTRALPHVS
jgi:hypothetical protein